MKFSYNKFIENDNNLIKIDNKNNNRIIAAPPGRAFF